MRPRSVPFGLILGGFVLVGMLAAAGLAVLLGQSPGDGEPVAGGRIVIVDDAGGLVTVDPMGGAARRYDLRQVPAVFPAFSPDGRRIAALGLRSGTPGIYVLDDAGSPSITAPVAEPIYDGADAPPFYFDWTPDSAGVSFLTSEADGGLSMRIVPADGSAEASMVRSASPLYWDWVDATRVLVHAGVAGPEAYFGEMDLASQVDEPAIAIAPVFRAPGVSSDGRFRAYVTATTEPGLPTDVWLVIDERDGDGERRIPLAGPTAFGWSPTAPELAYVGGVGATGLSGPLLLADASETSGGKLLDADVVAFFWSPDGRSIAAFSVPGESDRSTQGGRVQTRLSIIDVASRTVGMERLVALSDAFLEQLVPFFDQYALSHRIWSPDSDAVVLPLVDDQGVGRVSILDVDGSAPREIGRGPAAFWSP